MNKSTHGGALPVARCPARAALIPAALLLFLSMGGREMTTEYVYGQAFPAAIQPNEAVPEAVEYGLVTVEGHLASVGHEPFTQLALKMEREEDLVYYILNDGIEHLRGEQRMITLQGMLSITPIYFIDNRLAFIEYHLSDVQKLP